MKNRWVGNALKLECFTIQYEIPKSGLDPGMLFCICMVYEVEANTGINTSGESALIT